MRRGAAAIVLAIFLALAFSDLAPAFTLSEQDGDAKGDGIADDTAALQAVLDSGKLLVLGEGNTYRITRRLDIRRDGTEIRANTATLLMDSRDGAFDNAEPERKYGTNAVGILAKDVSGISISGLRIRFAGQRDDRYVKAIALRRVTDFRIEGNDIRGFSKADGIIYVGASSDGRITGNVIRDAHTNSRTRGQITGIVLDDDDAGSSDIMISGNEIRDLTVGPDFRQAFNVQTDGINLTVRSHDIEVRRNRISNVGEGIDTFATRALIADNRISDTPVFGIKLIHGASDSEISNNTILRAGIGGIVISNSLSVKADTSGNTITGNVIRDVNADGAADRKTTFGIGIVGKPKGTRVVRNRITGNHIALGGRALFGIYADKGIASANEASGNVITGWTRAEVRAEPEALTVEGP